MRLQEVQSRENTHTARSPGEIILDHLSTKIVQDGKHNQATHVIDKQGGNYKSKLEVNRLL